MNTQSYPPHISVTKKSWTVMVYLAADDNLIPFGVNSLRQMKAAASPNINVVAEFDSGPMNKSKRYYFDGKAPFGPLEDSEIKDFGPIDAGDYKNLEGFIEWAAATYPADHYFAIIWGHGGGVADDIPAAPDNTFVPRHPLLSLYKGVLDYPQKSVLDDPLVTTSNLFTKQSFENGFDAISANVIAAAIKIAGNVLSDQAMNVASQQTYHGGLKIDSVALSAIRNQVDTILQQDGAVPKEGPLPAWQQGILAAVSHGFMAASQTGILDQLQKEVLDILWNGQRGSLQNISSYKTPYTRLRDILCQGFLLTLQDSMLEALEMGIFTPSGAGITGGTKSLAFVDDPTAYITNAELKAALMQVKSRIKAKIDILGMDSCNMNMVEIGYELRDCVRFMIASQDAIPDASWPYDRILSYIAQNPTVAPDALAIEATRRYVSSYQEYGSEAVTLSVLNLDFCAELANLVATLTSSLLKAKGFQAEEPIAAARHLVQNFGQNQFVDLVHLCQLLTRGSGRLANVADKDIAPLEFPVILHNEVGPGEPNSNGTSIYFPTTVPTAASDYETLERYSQLDFAKITGWADFLRSFLRVPSSRGDEGGGDKKLAASA